MFEVRRGPLYTLIRSSRWRLGGGHFDPEVAVGGPAEEGEGRRKDGGRPGRKEEGGPADIKSNNPHLTGRKQASWKGKSYHSPPK